LLENIGGISYAVSGICYFIFAALLLFSWRGRLEGGLFISSIIFQLIWSIILTLHMYDLLDTRWLFISEVLRDGSWLLFFYRLLPFHEKAYKGRVNIIVYSVLAILLIASISITFVDSPDFHQRAQIFIIFSLLALSIGLLVLIEQFLRNIKPERRWSIKFLCLGVGLLYVFDLYLYSDAALFSSVDKSLWEARGFVNALVVPLLVISVNRLKNLSLEIFISRHVVFYSTGIFVVSVYLSLVSIGGIYIASYGGTWSGIAQVIFFVVSLIAMAVLISSDKTRAQMKIFVIKHFYKNRYDYREEWLRLIHNLSEYGSYKQFKEQVIQSMAVLIYSRGGALYLEDEENFIPVTNWNFTDKLPIIKESASLTRFLKKSDWIINVNEYRQQPEKYTDLHLDDEILELDGLMLIIPLKHHYRLIGYVMLLESTIIKDINWEVLDLLKAVSKQVSSYLAFIRTTEELNRAQQFNTFNRLSAYIVHDIKNQVSQLDLIVKNAQNFRDNPDFINDAFLTVENVVGRMQRLLAQLKQVNQSAAEAKKIKVCDLLAEAVMLRVLDKPIPSFTDNANEAYVFVDSERFKNVIESLIQNSQDATGPEGTVDIQLYEHENDMVISIQDNGCGMDAQFIRDRLFKPFDTTKGNAGMGIGVFEAREFAKYYAGELSVESEINKGTTMKLVLPKAAS